MPGGSTGRFLASTIGVGAVLALPASAAAIPIVSVPVPPPTLPAFQGSPASASPLPASKTTIPPQNPFMATDPNSNIHNDAWMTGAYPLRSGPLGRSLVASSEAKSVAICGSLAFDSRGRIVSVCPSAVAPPQARLIDPNTLATIATYDLPNAPDPPGTKLYQNFSGGGYFFLDSRDRIWVPTKTDHIYVVGQTANGQGFVLNRDYDLTSVLDTANERITSALPDFRGRIWFVTKQNGKVGTLDPASGAVRIKRLDEEIENSFSVDHSGVYIVSDKRMYRFKAKRNGAPKVVWKKRYPNSGIVKPSQVNAGSGTTPDVMRGGFVTITDNADPMNVVVYRTAKRLHGERRVVCEVPVFEKGASATENSLITSGNSIVVENNYGYQDPFGPNGGSVSEPGFARVDIDADGRGCHKVWTNRDARAPSVVPKLSARTGLIYAYTRPPDASEGYYWTAIDFRSGRTKWSRYAGSGLLFNNNYAGLSLGPDGTAYLGVIGGMLALRDATGSGTGAGPLPLPIPGG